MVQHKRTMGVGAFILLFAAALPARGEEGFRSLFDGKTLSGWEQHGGKAKYYVEDGQVVGVSVPKTPNSFLCTQREYGDFVLELEFKVDPLLNSGIQIRSLVFDEAKVIELPNGKTRKIPADRVHGYQVEIDPSPRALFGRHLRRGAARLAERPGAKRTRAEGLQAERVEPFPHRLPGRLHQNLAQRRRRGRFDRRNDRQGLNRPAGARRGR